MEYAEALEHKGRKVRYGGEEYVLLQMRRRKEELMKGVPNPFSYLEFDAIIFHPERNAARIVPIEELERLPEKLFRRRLQFGEVPVQEVTKIMVEV